MTRPLGQRRFVGALRIGARREGERGGQHLAPECLRRLRQKDRLARQALPSRSVEPSPGAVDHAPRFTVSRAGSAATAAPDSAAAAIVRVIRSAVTNGRAASWMTKTSVSRSGGAERIRHRVLPPASAGDQAHGLSAAQVHRRIVDHRLRERDDDLRDVRMREKCADAAVEHRAAGDRQQLLERASAEALASSPGGDDGGDRDKPDYRWR